MKCPYCSRSELKVLETRESNDNITRRRKECDSCKARFTTYESIEVLQLMVIKRDGKKEAFDRDKIISGMRKACEKRDIDDAKIEALADEIVAKVQALGKKEIKSTKIGLYVINKLRKLDSVAYLRFASVYKDFDAIEQFEEEISKLQKIN